MRRSALVALLRPVAPATGVQLPSAHHREAQGSRSAVDQVPYPRVRFLEPERHHSPAFCGCWMNARTSRPVGPGGPDTRRRLRGSGPAPRTAAQSCTGRANAARDEWTRASRCARRANRSPAASCRTIRRQSRCRPAVRSSLLPCARRSRCMAPLARGCGARHRASSGRRSARAGCGRSRADARPRSMRGSCPTRPQAACRPRQYAPRTFAAWAGGPGKATYP